MKIWYGHGSEHSMNLVMIGQFRDAATATAAKQTIDKLTDQFRSDESADRMETGVPADRFTDNMLRVLKSVDVYSIGPTELEQFGYEFSAEVEDDKVVVTTEESDVSALLKLLILKGARVEVYSAHDYPETGYGRNS